MAHQIIPVRLGDYWVDQSKIALFNQGHGKKQHLTHGFFAVQDDSDDLILIDAGCPSAKEAQELSLPFPVDNCVEICEAMQRAMLSPSKVKLIILTNLLWNHSWNLGIFPNAEILVQRREMEHAVSPFLHERESYCLTETTFLRGWTKGILRMKPIDGDCEVKPGIRIIRTPGQTPGSQSVIVTTQKGDFALVGSWAYEEQNWTQSKPTGDALDLIEWHQSLDRLKFSHAVILPDHADAVYQQVRYG